MEGSLLRNEMGDINRLCGRVEHGFWYHVMYGMDGMGGMGKMEQRGN